MQVRGTLPGAGANQPSAQPYPIAAISMIPTMSAVFQSWDLLEAGGFSEMELLLPDRIIGWVAKRVHGTTGTDAPDRPSGRRLLQMYPTER